MDASDLLTQYLNDYNDGDFVVDLANTLGIGNSMSACARIDRGACAPSDCSSNEPGIG
jgi:hypothetical protein